MTTTEPLFSIDLGDNGSLIEPLTWDDAKAWIEHQTSDWEWLNPFESGPAANGRSTHLSNINQLRGRMQDAQNNNSPLQGREALQAYFGGQTPNLIHSEGRLGQAVQTVRRVMGDESAGFAVACLLGNGNFDINRRPDHWKIAILLAEPELAAPAEIAEVVSADKRQARGELTRIRNEVIREREEAQAEWRGVVQSAQRRQRTMARRALSLLRGHREKRDRDVAMAIADIKRVEKTYDDFMNLNASTGYWSAKAQKHATERDGLTNKLVGFLAFSVLALLFTFYMAGCFVMETAGYDVSDFIRLPDVGRGGVVPTPIYIIVSAGLAALTTILFWIGRVLLRLYLSEHHLEQNARERLTMTSTYLALMREGAALPEDRLVILNALFRPTTDGIVKDDGPSEASIPGWMMRLADRPLRAG